MEGEKRISSQLGPVKLFVGCVPPEISLATLEEHFSRYGEVQQVTKLSRKKASAGTSSANSKGLGHCVVTVSGWKMAEEILRTPAHTIQGRKLLVEQYLQGSARFQNVELRNQKRFFLKGIPSYIEEEQLLDWLSSKHGEIEVLHEIRPRAFGPGSLNSLPLSNSNESNSPKIAFRKLPTKIYSVQFKKLEQAIKFSKSSQRYFKNNRIQVERYDFSRGNNLLSPFESSSAFNFQREVSSHQVLSSRRIDQDSMSSQREVSNLFCKPTQAVYHALWTRSQNTSHKSERGYSFQQSHGYRFNLAVRRSLSG